MRYCAALTSDRGVIRAATYITQVVDSDAPECLVLAKYMGILTPTFVVR